MNYFDALLLGLVEGVAEFLPISSTGHLVLLSHWLGIPDDVFLKSFEIFIQLGAIAAVVFVYWRSFLSIKILSRLICSFIPTALLGFFLYPIIKVLLGSQLVVVAALATGGAFLILFERFHKESEKEEGGIESVTYRQALLIGLFQSVSMIPGVSRSAATIIGGLLLGLKRVTIVEYSFLLAVPTISAATAYDLLKSYKTFPFEALPLMSVGFFASFVVALFVINFLLSFLKKYNFTIFGWYRIILAILFYIFIL